MTNEQWKKLIAVINGEVIEPLPVGFIIDSPWLPGWAGMSVMDYFASEQMWFEANLKAVCRFPDVMFLPGFWAEFGMCTEPSAFGTKCSWQDNELPYADKIIKDVQQVPFLHKPNPRTDGLLPFVIHRLKHYQPRIVKEGHAIKFAVSRGPLNVATFLMGCTEFLTAIRTNPDTVYWSSMTSSVFWERMISKKWRFLIYCGFFNHLMLPLNSSTMILRVWFVRRVWRKLVLIYSTSVSAIR